MKFYNNMGEALSSFPIDKIVGKVALGYCAEDLDVTLNFIDQAKPHCDYLFGIFLKNIETVCDLFDTKIRYESVANDQLTDFFSNSSLDSVVIIDCKYLLSKQDSEILRSSIESKYREWINYVPDCCKKGLERNLAIRELLDLQYGSNYTEFYQNNGNRIRNFKSKNLGIVAYIFKQIFINEDVYLLPILNDNDKINRSRGSKILREQNTKVKDVLLEFHKNTKKISVKSEIDRIFKNKYDGVEVKDTFKFEDEVTFPDVVLGANIRFPFGGRIIYWHVDEGEQEKNRPRNN